MSKVKTHEKIERKTLKNLQKFLQDVSKENKIEEKVIYKDYLKTTETVTKKKYNTQIEEFDFYTLRRIPNDKYIFYYDTNGYMYIKEQKKMRMIAYYDRNKKIVSFQGKTYSTLEKFIKKSFNQNSL